MKLRNVLAIIKLRSKTGSPSLRRIMSDENGIPNNNIDGRRNDYDILPILRIVVKIMRVIKSTNIEIIFLRNNNNLTKRKRLENLKTVLFDQNAVLQFYKSASCIERYAYGK